MVGAENLPPADQAAVYVANHASFLDIFSLFRLCRPFKFVSKPEIFLFPIVGWSMFLTGHILLKRTDKKSQASEKKRELLGKAAPRHAPLAPLSYPSCSGPPFLLSLPPPPPLMRR